MSLLDSELLSRGKPAEVPHISHQLVVLHAVVDVRNEHLHWISLSPVPALKGFGHLAIVGSLDPDLGNVAVVETLVRKIGIHPHLVCWHPTEPNQELPTYESVTQRDALINI